MGNWRLLTAGMARVPLLPTVMLFACGITWGLSFSFNKIAATAGIPTVAYVFWQSLGAGLILLILCFATANRVQLSWPHLKLYGVAALFELALPFLALNYVAARLPAGVVSLGQALVPALTFGFALAFRVDRFNTLRFVGLCIGLGAVLLVVLPKASLPSPDMAVWVLVSFLTPICYAVANVLIPLLRPPQSASLALAAAMSLTGAFYMGLVMLATGEWWWFEGGAGAMGPGDWALIAVALIIAIFLWLLFEIIRLAGPVFFSVQNYIATLSGIGWGMLIHGEAHSLWIWLALVLLFFGLALVVVGSLKAETRP